MIKHGIPFVIGKEYSLFMGRKTGSQVLKKCLGHLEKAHPETAVPVSFKNIRFMDFSAADEFIRKLVSRVTGKEFRNIFIYLTSVSDTLKENIEAALRLNQQAALLWNSGRAPEIIGILNPQLRDTWELANRKKQLTARELADTMGLPINTSSNRLARLYALGLVHQSGKKGASGGGQEYIYEPVFR